ncbi:MAG: DUF2264 domain-containing protein [Tannerellaceae bacterium]|jgi:hypothetical protein|nr:DUF2264 domain-containing protein [Tannerellaceae bacterium]
MKKFLLFLFLSLTTLALQAQPHPTGSEDRALWVETLRKLSAPILTNLSRGALKQNMPYESLDSSRREFSYLEAVGRLLCGIAPWLELGPDDTPEGRLRTAYIAMTLAGIRNAVDPSSPDYLDFDRPSQALVDAAFLAQALLRAPTQLWGKLDAETKARLITELKRSRSIRPGQSNWLLFASIVEAALKEFAGEYDSERLMQGVNRFRNDWYKGDAVYGDGAEFHFDYYNSFVIHPMFTDVLRVMQKHGIEGGDFLGEQLRRHGRYAEILERMISPEGAYPVVGRSIAYRFGIFHALSHASLEHILPQTLAPAQVRCALTAVIRRQMSSPQNFDSEGWLRVGFNGSQLNISERYINTGSIYLCATVLLPLGLPASDPFWSAPYAEWTGLRAWTGKEVAADHALH